MKCYVCYRDNGYEGYTKPEKVFWYRKDAEAWKKSNGEFAEYVEMEIE